MSHNGYSNRATWAVASHTQRCDASRRRWKGKTLSSYRKSLATPCSVLTADEAARIDLSAYLHDWLQECDASASWSAACGNNGSLTCELLDIAINDVNMLELARMLLRENVENYNDE